MNKRERKEWQQMVLQIASAPISERQKTIKALLKNFGDEKRDEALKEFEKIFGASNQSQIL